MTGRHDRDDLRAFLDGDLRQVWAVHRITGEPHYLAEGQALAVRDRAKREWRCPVPNCTVRITTVSGERRHHFRHDEPAPHASDGESEAHLAAKAMLAAWAGAQVPGGGHVRQEESIKDPQTALHRIADVMVTWPTGTKTAFEVEYKPYAPSDWCTKQDDYDANNIPCVWLLGHTKVKPARPPKHTTGYWSNAVKVPILGAAFAATGRHILVINPMTKQVGTLAGDRDFTERVTRPEMEAWLAPDHIDTCDLDPALGLVTPTMRRIDAAIAAREEARRRDEEARRLRAERLAEQRNQEEAEAARKQEQWARIEANNQAAWDCSDLRRQATERWGDHLPDLLTKPTQDTWGIHAIPVHWHTAIYLHHIHEKPRQHRFTVTDCYAALTRERINKNWDNKKAFKALINYLKVLDKAGLITIRYNERGYVADIATQGLTIDDVLLAAKKREQERSTRAQQAQAAGSRTRKERVQDARRAADERWQKQQERLRNIDAIKADQAARWEASDIRRLVSDVHGGGIPAAITWPGGTFLTAIDATPAHWHAHIYMRHIHGQPAGTPIDARTAIATLQAEGINLQGDTVALLGAVNDYLYNLSQRCILARPGGDPSASGFVVVTDALRQMVPTPAPEPVRAPTEESDEPPLW